jgi:hypothetical protein
MSSARDAGHFTLNQNPGEIAELHSRHDRELKPYANVGPLAQAMCPGQGGTLRPGPVAQWIEQRVPRLARYATALAWGANRAVLRFCASLWHFVARFGS